MLVPRRAREYSESGIYHVMLRGIDRQSIFQENEDRERFLWILRECKEICQFRLYTYCLMDNHIHLLLRTGQESEPLEQIFKRIGVRYAAWYNHKYSRTGHLFQDRFLSEAVNDDSYLWTVFSYIHQNPVKAGLCKMPGKYAWSGWREYLHTGELCDVQEFLELLDEDRPAAMKLLQALLDQPLEGLCMDVEQRKPSDQEVREMLLRLCGTDKITKLQSLPRAERDDVIRQLKQERASIRQISRLTGWPFGIVRRDV